MRSRVKYQVPPVIWAIVIYFLSAIPNVHLIFKTSPGVDKIVHAALYFILCWLVWRAFYHQDTLPVVRNSAFLGAFIFCVVYGFLDEYPVSALKRYEPEMLTFFETKKSALITELRDKKAIDDDLKAKMIAAMNEVKKEFTA